MSNEPRIDPDTSGKFEFRGFDRLIAELAERQHGVVARPQLLLAGVPDHVIEHRLILSRLHPIHHGVYAVGHRRLSKEGRWMGAVLAAGPDAVLSHRSAATLLGFGHWPHVEVTARRRRERRGMRVYTFTLAPDEVSVIENIPATTVPRTLLDLATVLPAHQVERAINEAEVQRRTDPLSLLDLVTRYPGRRGIRTIRSILSRLETGSAFTRSELESRFVAFVRKARLPAPSLNAHVSGYECDCVWPGHRLVVELDGHATHATRAGFERDRTRDRSLNAAGWRTVRVTWRQLHESPEALAADLRTMLV
jgi:very-short-patch-repair endonuclease